MRSTANSKLQRFVEMYQICNRKNEMDAHAHNYTYNRPKEYSYQLVHASGTGQNTTNNRAGVFILKHTEGRNSISNESGYIYFIQKANTDKGAQWMSTAKTYKLKSKIR